MSLDCIRRQHGFTLIEALMTILVLGILLGLAAPSFVSFTANQRVKTVSFDVYASLVYARSEAIKRREAVSIEPVSGGDWATGWTVKTTSSTLRTQGRVPGVAMFGPASVAYRGDGRLTSGSTVGILIQPGSYYATVGNRCVRVDLTGLPKSTLLSGTACP